MIMKNYVADELANKVYHLSKALDQAREIIEKMDAEHKLLQDAFINLVSIKKDCDPSQEAICESINSR